MSGFFAIRRSAVTADVLKPLGYKILLELAVRCRPREVAEVPFVFQDRFAGESKSTAREGMRFLRHLAALRTAPPVARMVGFGLIGAHRLRAEPARRCARSPPPGLHYLPAEIARQPVRRALELRPHRACCCSATGAGTATGRTASAGSRCSPTPTCVLRIPLIALFVDGSSAWRCCPPQPSPWSRPSSCASPPPRLLIYLPGRGGRAKEAGADASLASGKREKEGTP